MPGGEDIQSIIEQKVSTLFRGNLKPDPRDERYAKMWVYVKRIIHDLMDEPAMRILCKNIAKSSGDIRIVFDIMKSAVTQLLQRVQKSPESSFVMKPGSQYLPEKFSITLEMIVGIIDAKRGPRVRQMLEKLPNNDLFVLDAISAWYDEHGEEKTMPYDNGKHYVEKYC